MQTFDSLLQSLSESHIQELNQLKIKNEELAEQLERLQAELKTKSSQLETFKSDVKSKHSETSERTKKHLQKLALRCTDLQEKLDTIKLMEHAPPEDARQKAIEKTILRLVNENARLFLKIGTERQDHQFRELKLNQRIAELEKKLEIDKEAIAPNTMDIDVNEREQSENELFAGFNENNDDLGSPENPSQAILPLPSPISFCKTSSNPVVPVKSSVLAEKIKTAQSVNVSKINNNRLPLKHDLRPRTSELASPSLLRTRPPEQSTPDNEPKLKKYRKSPKDFKAYNLLGKTSGRKAVEPLKLFEMSNSKEIETPSHSGEIPPKFKYQEVVRDKNTRRQMHGLDCACCADVITINSVLQIVQRCETYP